MAMGILVNYVGYTSQYYQIPFYFSIVIRCPQTPQNQDLE